MNPAWVLSKTDKGREEIATRAEHLPQPARTALILVDGQATLDELLRRNSAFTTLPQELNGLLEAGFVTVYAKRTAPPVEPRGLELLRERLRDRPRRVLAELVQMANDAIGPEAIIVTRRLNSARDATELRLAIERAAIAVESYAGTAKASQFRLRGDTLIRQRFGG